MGTWHILKSIAAKKAGSLKDKIKGRQQEPIDIGLPLDIHLGGSITLDPTPFLINGEALAMTNPGRNCIVKAYGRCSMAGSMVHRFYMESESDPNLEPMLQIVTSQARIEECRIFTGRDEVFPESAEEWQFWLDESDGYIGWEVFEDKEEHTYDRVWSRETQGRTSPLEFTETVYLDRFGETTVTVNHSAMLYGRIINESDSTAEYLLISAESHSDDTAVVQLSAGIDIIPESLKINY